MTGDAVAPALGCAAAAAVIALLRRHAARLPKATPNARTLHDGDVPRAGGVAILAGMLVAGLVAPPALPGSAWVWLAAVVAVAGISFADDVRGVPASVRLAVHACAAVAVVSQLVDVTTAPLLALVVAFAIVWGANLFNFMDGSDGLAAAMAIVGFAAYAVAAWHASAASTLTAAIAAAVVPFFIVNRPRASMFMGDVGAVPLGFLAAALGAAGWLGGRWPAWFPLIVFMPFIADATLTLAARAMRGEAVWRAHRSHFYQRLNTLGAGHQGTLSIYVAAMLACSTLALVCLAFAPHRGVAALTVVAALHLMGLALIDYHWRKRQGAGL